MSKSDTATDTAAETAAVAAADVPELDPAEVCAACPHALSDHDGIEARYCAATAASTRDRGCICGRG